MAMVTFQVIDGADKGIVFADMPTPLTVGRENGNGIRLNDERVSRFHIKVQEDHGQIVLTDLDSTNGTRVNGQDVQLRVLRVGDVVRVGHSVLLFGSPEEIANVVRAGGGDASRLAPKMSTDTPAPQPLGQTGTGDEPTLGADARLIDSQVHRRRAEAGSASEASDESAGAHRDGPPPLPADLSPAQAAQLAELLDYVHRNLADLAETVSARPKATRIQLAQDHWQNLLALEMLLARYLRRVADPDDE
jgi:pSer/pThr/pTyr-binding forkhead associated (FHA) protein